MVDRTAASSVYAMAVCLVVNWADPMVISSVSMSARPQIEHWVAMKVTSSVLQLAGLMVRT